MIAAAATSHQSLALAILPHPRNCLQAPKRLGPGHQQHIKYVHSMSRLALAYQLSVVLLKKQLTFGMKDFV
eukprot:scaffold167876_cov34-Prasinocladus_malaysianus.AAC.1